MSQDPRPDHNPEFKVGEIVCHRTSDQKGVIENVNFGKMTNPPISYGISTTFGNTIEEVPPWLIKPYSM